MLVFFGLFFPFLFWLFGMEIRATVPYVISLTVSWSMIFPSAAIHLIYPIEITYFGRASIISGIHIE